MRKVADWQLAQPGWDSYNSWKHGALFAGVMATYQTTLDQTYYNAAVSWATTHNWQLGPDMRLADDHCPGQTYLELHFIEPDPNRIQDTKDTFDFLIANPVPGREEWYWCDALFMSPPVLTRLYAATTDSNYLSYLNDMYWDTTEYLYDPNENLFYRDDRYFDDTSPNGEKLFWSRGNGWVLAGLARVLQYLPPTDPYYADYVTLFQDMSAKIATLLGQDGLWRSNLLDPNHYPNPETSGTGFFCYGLAWGINEGILNENTYFPVIEKAWEGLTGAVHESGKLGWVQQAAAEPGPATWDNTEIYGVGAFLLAGSETTEYYSAGISVESNMATLTVDTAPVITVHPQDQTVCDGSSVQFCVTATAASSYQWKKDGTNTPAATGSCYTINPVTTADAGNYTCVVSNSCGSTESNVATLTVNTAPVITVHPQDKTVCDGNSVQFCVTPTGASSYQWKKDGGDIPGATVSCYTINPVTAADAGNYTCVVSNSCGSATSNPATLTVCVNPLITQQPQDATVSEGEDAVFTVAASGCGPFQYQWKNNGANVGGDSNSLPLYSVQLSDNNSVITCEVSNTCGTVATNPAVLTVNPYTPDIEIHLVALSAPSSFATTEVLPSSTDSILVGQEYYVEVWASDVGSTNTGLTSVYVDLNYTPCNAVSIQLIDHSGPFGQFESGTVTSCGIDELGGSALPAAGMAPEWARVAVVSVRADQCGMVTHSLFDSATGVAALGRLQIPWSDIDLGEVTVDHTLAGGIIFVDGAATGANNGTSWTDAFIYLQDALDFVQSAVCSVNEIHVAKGVYKPDCNSTVPNGTGDRQATFQLISGVAFKGGYAGFGEPNADARDIKAYETILSGDLNGDDVDVNDPCDLLNEPTRTENSYHVVTGTNADANAMLDGFTITAGNASDATFAHSRGGGLLNDWSDPTVNKCTFSKNAALFLGGAMCNLNSKLTVTRCTFGGNAAGIGGGMGNDGSSPWVTHCTFTLNSAIYGGGMGNINFSSPILTNCTFAGNSADFGGGLNNLTNSSSTLTNCTFTGNSANRGGAIDDVDSVLTVTNCILWANTAATGSQIYNLNASAAVTYSDVQGGWMGTGNIDSDPFFDYDYHLYPWSPCVNSGDNNSVPADITDIDGDGNIAEPTPFDLEGNPRMVGDAIDMGAWEWQDANVYGAFRDLPAYPVNWPRWMVRVLVNPGSSVSVYAVEDTPPDGWTVDTNSISESGSWDQASGKVKWGTFPDSNPRVLTYEVNVAGATGCHTFSGIFSFDGVNELTGGDDEICVGWEHPADTDLDWCLVIEEVTGYEACYLTGCTWQVGPNPIPADYVSRAGYLWRYGECYHFDYDFNEPVWWQDNAGEVVQASASASEDSGRSVTRGFDAANYTAGSDFTVCLEISPKPGTQAYVVEDAPPMGWLVSNINEGGVWDAVNRKVKWGLFFGDSNRTLCYDIAPPYSARGVKMFSGIASFDGASSTSIRGITDKVGDYTLDNKVDFDDLRVLCNHWMEDQVFVDIAPPQTGDSIINLADFAEFSKHWLDGTEP
jgi:rhamnogalacturonyl hydrolase YesR